MEYEYYAFKNGENWYCQECFERVVLEDNPILMTEFRTHLEQGEPLDNEYVFDTIHVDTVQYEQYPGQILPLEGLYCVHCGGELVAPMEME